MSAALFLSLIALAAWIYLLAFRGGFWLARERDGGDAVPPAAHWPSVTAIVPARDEGETIARVIGSLSAQDYSGAFHILLVDDQSSDGTAAAARAVADGKLEILRGAEPPQGWTGKLWALQQGILHADAGQPDYFWFTDADIVHTPDNLRRLVTRAEKGKLALVSLMAKLRCESWAERFLIPAFVFFFAMLFPFAWVNRYSHSTAAAAGGCMLVNREALSRAGGIDSVRHEIIDDCALARLLMSQGGIWLGLTGRAVSLRPYPRLADIRRMVARSAYAQLGYSPIFLAGTIAGMMGLYIAPPAIALFGSGAARMVSFLAWLCMAIAFQPMLRFYRRSPLWGVALPMIGAVYALFTIDSAIQSWRGRGGMWKGRAQAMTRA